MAAPSQLVGQILGHYRILEQIGAGGMGVVYRAHDERLDRDVALKVLTPGALVDEAARKRFRKEALALSRLNHPNIAMVFDFDTQDDMDFLVIEYIPGTTLDASIGPGFLPEKQVVRLGLQLAEGLAAAHEQGVVHRDLKPSNLRVTPDGRLKILDFGIAKLLPRGERGTETLTEAQGVTGTLPYMAPEQLRGEQPDSRTDIYAAGAVLYEMATGRRPFEQRLPAALVNDIITKLPAPPRQINPKLSPKLEDIVLKCLEKECENRYQSATELTIDLRRLAFTSTAHVVVAPTEPRLRLRRALAVAGIAGLCGLALLFALDLGGWRERLLGTRGPSIRSIAVLPLENLSRDPEQEYFADGMTEELIADLCKISALRVISRTSAMHYKGTTKTVPEIARELNVDAIIEGSVLRSGARVRITAQLIEATADKHLWAESYERELKDVLTLQGEVARAIAEEINITLTPQEHAVLTSIRPVNTGAHELYLRGRSYWNMRTEEGVRTGMEYFQRAIKQDPGYSLAYAGVADCYNVLGFWNFIAPEEAYPRAKQAATKALELDEALAEAHTSLAEAKVDYDWDWSGAEKEFKRAIELKPSYATAHQWYADYFLIAMGRQDEAIAEMKRAQALDPLSLIINEDVGGVLYFARRYDQAIEQLRKTLELDPDFIPTHAFLGQAYEQKAMYQEAIAEFQRALTLSGGSPRYLAMLAHAHAAAGTRTQAIKILDKLREQSSENYVSPFEIGVVYAGLGEREHAFEWLEKAYEEHTTEIVTLKVEPRLDILRSDPRFQDLVRRVGLPQ